MNDILNLAVELIDLSSVTPEDKGCQDLIGHRLAALGFQLETKKFGNVTNLWARRGRVEPLFCFAGHTDVVPEGDLSAWDSLPFEATVKNNVLYGRGAADMKSSIAAFVTACERFITNYPDDSGSIAVLLTSDEEGEAIDGTARMVEWLASQQETIDFCIVGEPTCEQVLGDTIKNGRRGSLSGKLVVKGKPGHIAYPHLADNPIHKLAPALAALAALEWDHGNDFFPPTSWQVSNVHAGIGTVNVIPGQVEVLFNFRYCNEQTEETLKKQVTAILDHYGVDYEISWQFSGEPFLTKPGKLTDILTEVILAETSQSARLSTGGGTSDGRFIKRIARELVEFGPLNTTIHKPNECVRIDDLQTLSNIYEQLLFRLLIN